MLLYLRIHADGVIKLHYTGTVIHFAHRVTRNITQAGTELSFHLLFHLFCLQSLYNRFQLNDFCSQNFIYLCKLVYLHLLFVDAFLVVCEVQLEVLVQILHHFHLCVSALFFIYQLVKLLGFFKQNFFQFVNC